MEERNYKRIEPSVPDEVSKFIEEAKKKKGLHERTTNEVVEGLEKEAEINKTLIDESGFIKQDDYVDAIHDRLKKRLEKSTIAMNSETVSNQLPGGDIVGTEAECMTDAINKKITNKIDDFNIKSHSIKDLQAEALELIKTLRKSKGFKQKDMAAALKISIAGYSFIESGKRKLSADDLQKLFDKLGVKILFINGKKIV